MAGKAGTPEQTPTTCLQRNRTLGHMLTDDSYAVESDVCVWVNESLLVHKHFVTYCELVFLFQTRNSQGLTSAPPTKPRPTSMILPSQSYDRPLRPQPLPSDRLDGHSSLGTRMAADQCQEENIVNDFLEKTSSLAPRPSFPRPTIISPTHKGSNKATGHTCGEMAMSDQLQQDSPRGNHSTVTRPTIIGLPRHQSGSTDSTQARQSGSIDMTQVSSTVTCFTHDNNNGVSKKPKIRVVPFAKPEVAPKPHLAPKPFLRGVRPSHNAAEQESKLWPTLTASSVEKATAPVVEKGTKQSFEVIQRHTEKSVQKSIMTNIIKPHLGSSKLVQKAMTPLVDKATKQMYASAEKQTEASVNKAIVSTVVGQQVEPSQTVQRTKHVLSGNSQALPTTFKDKKLTASSVEKATAPVVEKGTKQSFEVIQRHTEKSVQKSIMTNIIKPHLGSSKFVQKATTPLVDKATKQMYASAEKQTEASVNKAIVSTVAGHQDPSESDKTQRAFHNNQARTSMTSAMSKSALSNNIWESSALLHRSEGFSTGASTKLVGNVAQKHEAHGNQSSMFQTPRIIRVSAAQKGIENSHSTATTAHSDGATSREATNLTVTSSSGRSMVNLTGAGLGSGKTASSEAPVARRRSIGNLRTKLSARPKSMNFDLLTTKRRDECRDVGRTQPSVVAHGTSPLKKKHAPPRPSAGPLRLSSKSFSHPSR